MRLTVSHNKGRDEAMKIIDQTAEDLFKGVPGAPVQIVDTQKRWDGPTLYFSFTGKMGFFTAPIKGLVFVTERDVTVDVELPGFVKSLVGEEKIRAGIEGRVKGLLGAPAAKA